MLKTLSLYISVFDYFGKILSVLSAANGVVSIALFAIAISAPVEITDASLILVFSISDWIAWKLFKALREKRKRNTIKLFYNYEVT